MIFSQIAKNVGGRWEFDKDQRAENVKHHMLPFCSTYRKLHDTQHINYYKKVDINWNLIMSEGTYQKAVAVWNWKVLK